MVSPNTSQTSLTPEPLFHETCVSIPWECMLVTGMEGSKGLLVAFGVSRAEWMSS